MVNKNKHLLALTTVLSVVFERIKDDLYLNTTKFVVFLEFNGTSTQLGHF